MVGTPVELPQATDLAKRGEYLCSTVAVTSTVYLVCTQVTSMPDQNMLVTCITALSTDSCSPKAPVYSCWLFAVQM